MILQALTQYYENLLSRGKIAPPGWGTEKVSFGWNLGEGGEVLSLLPLETEQLHGKTVVLAPQALEVPAQVKRTVDIAANFLCDTARYLLGIDDNAQTSRTRDCFASSRALHTALLAEIDHPAARAVCAYYERWNPEMEPRHPALMEFRARLMTGARLLFFYRGTPLTGFPEIRAAWQRYYDVSDEGPVMRCLVTGRRVPVPKVHPAIRGVRGAQPSGAALVSFNAPACASYGQTQNRNAPVGRYAAFAYTAALNSLLADREHCFRLGDMTVVCWAQSGEAAYQEMSMWRLFGKALPRHFHETDLLAAVHALTAGRAVAWDNATLSPEEHIYILALAPNAARLSVRFFLQDQFGSLLRHIEEHDARLEIERPSYDRRERLSLWSLLYETVNRNVREPSIPAQLAGDTLRAVLQGSRYPATLLQGTLLRIRAEREITRGRAAILKAYYLRNEHPECPKEVLTVGLNEESQNVPYTLGRLFAVMEALQDAANPGLNMTVKDRYFNAAASTPATVFPLLCNLAQKHLRKLGGGLRVTFDRQLAALMGVLGESYPARLTLAEQGSFHLGYYHQRQRRFTKKEEQADV